MARYNGTAIIGEADIKGLQEFLRRKKEEMTADIVQTLAYVGETAVKIAREDHTGNWNDITGNLRSSIGYAVLVDGKEVEVQGERFRQTSGPKGDGGEGVAAARKLIETLRPRYSGGIVLLVVAGMKYAAYVEEVRHKVVLSQARLEAESLARRMLRSLHG